MSVGFLWTQFGWIIIIMVGGWIFWSFFFQNETNVKLLLLLLLLELKLLALHTDVETEAPVCDKTFFLKNLISCLDELLACFQITLEY